LVEDPVELESWNQSFRVGIEVAHVQSQEFSVHLSGTDMLASRAGNE
jgi:hypothetical protein